MDDAFFSKNNELLGKFVLSIEESSPFEIGEQAAYMLDNGYFASIRKLTEELTFALIDKKLASGIDKVVDQRKITEKVSDCVKIIRLPSYVLELCKNKNDISANHAKKIGVYLNSNPELVFTRAAELKANNKNIRASSICTYLCKK